MRSMEDTGSLSIGNRFLRSCSIRTATKKAKICMLYKEKFISLSVSVFREIMVTRKIVYCALGVDTYFKTIKSIPGLPKKYTFLFFDHLFYIHYGHIP